MVAERGAIGQAQLAKGHHGEIQPQRAELGAKAHAPGVEDVVVAEAEARIKAPGDLELDAHGHHDGVVVGDVAFQQKGELVVQHAVGAAEAKQHRKAKGFVLQLDGRAKILRASAGAEALDLGQPHHA